MDSLVCYQVTRCIKGITNWWMITSGQATNRKNGPPTRVSWCSSATEQSPELSGLQYICCNRWKRFPPNVSSLNHCRSPSFGEEEHVLRNETEANAFSPDIYPLGVLPWDVMKRNLPATLDKAEDGKQASQGADVWHGDNLSHRTRRPHTQ